MDLALNNLQWLICHKTKPNFEKGMDLSPLPPQLSTGNHD